MGTCLLLLPLVPAIYVGSTGVVEEDIETDGPSTLGDQGTLGSGSHKYLHKDSKYLPLLCFRISSYLALPTQEVGIQLGSWSGRIGEA